MCLERIGFVYHRLDTNLWFCKVNDIIDYAESVYKRNSIGKIIVIKVYETCAYFMFLYWRMKGNHKIRLKRKGGT